MQVLHSLEIVSAALFALSGAWLIILGLGRWFHASDPAAMPAKGGTAVFVFEGEELVDASPAAWRLLGGRGSARSDLGAVTDLLSRGFGSDLGDRLANLPGEGQLRIDSGTGLLEAGEQDGALRVSLHLPEVGGAGLDRLSLEAAQEELALLRGIAEDAPQPIWALDAAGALAWANRAYLDLAEAARPPEGPEAARAPGLRGLWPADPVIPARPDLPEGQVHRQRVPLAMAGREEPLWFDLTSVGRGAGSLHFAADVGSLVQAESARIHFVQALAKTFADLATGLAIFDRQRQLVLFNPAFVDLTGLPVTFLSARPLVQTVLDRLREAKILPEPRDYASWREEVAALESAAAQGAFAETWTLPSGRTYRVTGRPHPDGALAFLFEDITDELGLTRRFRDELEAVRAALDESEEALAIFASGGALSHCNATYRELWGSPSPHEGDFTAELLRWEAGCLPSAAWARLREGGRGPFAEDGLSHRDGRRLSVRTSPLPHGARLLTFRLAPVSPASGENPAVLASRPGPERRDEKEAEAVETGALVTAGH